MFDRASARFIFLATTIASFLTPFMGSSVNVALPAIGKEYNMTAISLGWVATAFLLASAITLVPLGRLADIYGRKKMFTSGAVILGLACMASVWSPTEAVFIFFRSLQGVGAAMIFSTGTALLISAYPPENRGEILGMNVASVYVGLTVGPFIGGVLTEHLGWKTIFIFSAFLAAGAAVCSLKIAEEEPPEARKETFDGWGCLLYAAALFALMYGFSRLPSKIGVVLVMVGLLCLALFARSQWKKDFPLLNVHLFAGNRTFAFSNLAALINYCATFAVTFLLSLYLQHIKMMTPSETGMVLLVSPLLQALFSPLAGRLSDRYEPRYISSVGMMLTVLGLSGMIFISEETPLSLIVICLVVLGIGFALFSSPNVNAVMSSVESRDYGVASATLATMRMVGQMLSMGIAMLFFALFIGDQNLTGENDVSLIQSARWIFVVLTAICVLGVFSSLVRGRVHKR